MLVVLEGLDGSGKSTQVKRLRTYLQTRFENLEYIQLPRKATHVYRLLIGNYLPAR